MARHSATGGAQAHSDARTSPTDSIVERAKAHDSEAWRRLVDLCGPLVYRAGRQAGLQAEDAADLVQDVFTALVGHIAEFRGAHPQRSFLAWLRTITRNKICDHFRGGRRRPDAIVSSEAIHSLLGIPKSFAQQSSKDQTALDQAEDEVFLLHRALQLVGAEFGERTWQAFWLVVVEGRSPAHVADDLGMTRHAVYKAKSRILSRLRHELSDLLQH
jgi:RNA polymerase sigma-70 factor (ECF subfamily)